jgi:hypothetical protein
VHSTPQFGILNTPAENSAPVVGQARDLPTLKRTARAPLTEFETFTADLWLAVGREVPLPQPKKKR